MLITPKVVFSPEVNVISDALETSEALNYVYSQVNWTHSLTISDRQLIKSVLLQENLGEEEYRTINRILYSVRRGWIKIVEELQHPVSSRAKRLLQVLESVT